MRKLILVCAFVFALLSGGAAFAARTCSGEAKVCDKRSAYALPLFAEGKAAPLIVDSGIDAGTERAIEDLQQDISRVGGVRPELMRQLPARSDAVVIIGSVDGPIIRRLEAAGKLDLASLRGTWEGYLHQVVDRPAPGVARALVIVGSDKRGVIFGAYDLSQGIGVSPWHWWADVPPLRKERLYVGAGKRIEQPKVKYRGIFINDEEPALGGWVNKTFGGFNHQFYGKVYELILRMRGNYLWPAMWGKALYDDDPRNASLANEYGVVIGTSHHEPMMRAHVEWERYGKGPWDYGRNADALRAFWRKGIERMGANESLVTVGMRGDGDEPMTEGTAISLLETIVRDQRSIIGDVTGRPPEDVPQVWALYKEVQDYYDKGMRVPDDVTLLFADDNWGNIRRLPDPGVSRRGGYGVYYHFDYVGGPRNYKWLNTNQIERTWQQMRLAHDYGADRLWIVNVGDIKPMEYPTSFFMDLAWDPDAMTLEELQLYPRRWAELQFGQDHSAEVAALVTRYAQLAARRKPELLDAGTYDLAGGEWDRVIAEWDALAAAAEALEARLPAGQRDAYFQLVLHPVQAFGNLHRLYAAVARNHLHFSQGRSDANRDADQAEAYFAKDAAIRERYEAATSGGKWTEMMSQTHIGYTGWQQPPKDVMPEVRRISPNAAASMGVAERNTSSTRLRPLHALRPDEVRFIDVFNRGEARFAVSATPNAGWIKIDRKTAQVGDATSFKVAVNWKTAPAGLHEARIRFTGSTGQVETIIVPIDSRAPPRGSGFVESDGVIAIEADHHGSQAAPEGLRWRTVPNLARVGSGVSIFPATFKPFDRPGGTSPHLSYPIYLTEDGPVDVEVQVAPGLDFRGGGRHRFAISIDDGAPVIVDVLAGESEASWNNAVARNVRLGKSRVDASRGRHDLRIWAVDPGVVFQRVSVIRGAAPAAYLGAMESVRR